MVFSGADRREGVAMGLEVLAAPDLQHAAEDLEIHAFGDVPGVVLGVHGFGPDHQAGGGGNALQPLDEAFACLLYTSRCV